MTNNTTNYRYRRARCFWKPKHAHRELTRSQSLAQSALKTAPPSLQSPSEPAESMLHSKPVDVKLTSKTACCRNGRKKKVLGATHASPSPASALPVSSVEQTIPDGLGLGRRDVVDDEADTTLGDDVGGAIAALNGDHGLGSYQPEHGEQIDHWVGKPRNDSDHL